MRSRAFKIVSDVFAASANIAIIIVAGLALWWVFMPKENASSSAGNVDGPIFLADDRLYSKNGGRFIGTVIRFERSVRLPNGDDAEAYTILFEDGHVAYKTRATAEEFYRKGQGN